MWPFEKKKPISGLGSLIGTSRLDPETGEVRTTKAIDLLLPGFRKANRTCGICGPTTDLFINEFPEGLYFGVRCDCQGERCDWFSQNDWLNDRYSKLIMVPRPAPDLFLALQAPRLLTKMGWSKEQEGW